MRFWEIGANVAATRGHVWFFWGRGRDEATAGTENCLEATEGAQGMSFTSRSEQTALFRHLRLRLCQGGGGESS